MDKNSLEILLCSCISQKGKIPWKTILYQSIDENLREVDYAVHDFFYKKPFILPEPQFS